AAPVIPLGGTARTRTAGRIRTPAAAFAAETSAARYARRSGPLEVQTKAPSGETSAHIALAMSAGSSGTRYRQPSVTGAATANAPWPQALPPFGGPGATH